MQKYFAIGRLADDPKDYGAGENPCVYFTLAVQSENRERAYYPEFVAYGVKRDLVLEWLAKGSQIGVEAHVRTYSRDEGDGVSRKRTIFVLDRVEFISRCGKGRDGAAAAPEAPEPSGDDIPF